MRLLFLIVLFYASALSAQTERAADIYGVGVRAYYAQDYTTALARYTTAIGLKPNTIGYIYSRGLTYQKLHMDSLADLDFQRVVKLDPKYLDAWYQLGMIQIDEKHYDNAIEFFSHARSINPKDVNTLHQLGLVLYYKHKYFDAIDIFTQIIQINPDDEQAFYKRGLAKFNDDDFVAAASDFSDCYRINPENTLALEQRALSFLRNNDLENACRDWNILQKKGNPRAWENISRYCEKK